MIQEFYSLLFSYYPNNNSKNNQNSTSSRPFVLCQMDILDKDQIDKQKQCFIKLGMEQIPCNHQFCPRYMVILSVLSLQIKYGKDDSG